eukprot:GHVU01097612.1.p1 GENE.GHVU01097612.1~~GHVU01097612.1.p1  ORF type:complete len:496 (-),score=114.10 GHVU01097612.1:337-1824(-)
MMRNACSMLRTLQARGPSRAAKSSLRAFSTLGDVSKLNQSLKEADPEMYQIIEDEKMRLKQSINLIPSENLATTSVMEAVGSVMTNKYSEGYPLARYYGGNEHIDKSELLCISRALQAFSLDKDQWGVNVQSLSGSPANFAVYNAMLNPHDRIMHLDLPHGGHLSHGYQIHNKKNTIKVSAVAKVWECLPYRLNEETGRINYDEFQFLAKRYFPKLVVAGASAYPYLIDYEFMRKVCDDIGAILLADIAHISGLMAADAIPSAFDYAHVVTTTTHKILRGPRGALIFSRKGPHNFSIGAGIDMEARINKSVFPGMQGGPHNHTIAGLAVGLKAVMAPEYKRYIQQVMKNSKAMADGLLKEGFNLVGGGTENHLMLVDLNSKGITGAPMEKVCERVNISLNKNTIPKDVSAMKPSGIRIGSPAMTSRGLGESDFQRIAQLLGKAAAVTAKVHDQLPEKYKIAEFDKYLQEHPETTQALKEEVVAFASQFPVVGIQE